MENGIGTQELLILVVIALILFGGRRWPPTLWQSIKAFRQSDGVSGEFHQNSIPLTLATVGVTLIVLLNVTKAITEMQALVSIGVLFVWAFTGWLLFWRK